MRKKASAPNHDSAVVIFHPDACGHVGWMDNKPNMDRVRETLNQIEEAERVAQQTVDV